jgi:hypothetical protein
VILTPGIYRCVGCDLTVDLEDIDVVVGLMVMTEASFEKSQDVFHRSCSPPMPSFLLHSVALCFCFYLFLL